jgi:hypothetical protein
MPNLLADHSGSSNPNDLSDYSGVLLSSDAEIRQLRNVADRLMPRDDTVFHPELFLASVSRGWKPRVVAVHRAHEVVGIMYTKERVIAGVPTGVVYADGSLDSILLANPLHRQQAFRRAVEVLLASSSIRGMRLRIPRSTGDLNAIKRLIASKHLDARYTRITKHQEGSHLWRHHAHLSLAGSYEAFLKGLGRATRHNFRYYRRRFEASGHRFVERLTIDELRAAAFEISPKSKLTDEPRQIDLARSMNMVAAARRPIAIGLRHHNGEWLSVIGGWYRPRGAVLLFQCNSDRHFGSDSLSVVLRAYFIETLIRQGLEELVIWDDTGPPLSRYVTYVPAIGVHLDVPTRPWRVARWFITTVGPRLPKRFATAAQWVAPLVLATTHPPAEWLNVVSLIAGG